MLRTSLLLSIIFLFAFSSCKKTGTTKACFTFSKEKVKVGDTLYLLNCSEYYEKFIWLKPGPMMDSVLRHNYIVSGATGTYEVTLYVGTNEFTSADFTAAKELKKSFTVE